MESRLVYMDHAATTPVHPKVLEAMMPYFNQEYGNPNSVHSLGRSAREAVDRARETVAQILNCQSQEIVFTSCGTESINLAIKGIAKARGKTGHIITSAIEHHAVLHTIEQLELEGYTATILPVSPDGLVDPDDVRNAIRPDTVVISIGYANNEIGTIQPIREIGSIAREAGIPFHTDAVQAAGSLSLNVEELQVDALSLSGHKFNAPKGVGILYIRSGIPLEPQMQGGGQESGRRSGTENVPYIVGIAEALRLSQENLEAHNEHCISLREKLFEGILSELPDTRVNGHRTQRLPNNAHVAFRGIEAQSILMGLDLKGICASSGSACHSASIEPSHVLKAIGVPSEYIYGSVRLTVGIDNSQEDVSYVLEVLPSLVRRLQSLSPLVESAS